MFTAVYLIVLGLAAAPNALLAKAPRARPFFENMQPYEAGIGALGAAWGVYFFVETILNVARYSFKYFVTSLAASVSLVALGLVLGVVILKAVAWKTEWKNVIGRAVFTVAPYQTKLGIVGVVVGVVHLYAWFTR